MSYVGYSYSENYQYAIEEGRCPKTHINKKYIEYIKNELIDEIDWEETFEHVFFLRKNTPNENEIKNKILNTNFKIKDIKDNLEIGDDGEWHHASKFYNEIKFYDISNILVYLLYKNE